MSNLQFNGEWTGAKVNGLEAEFLQECVELCENKEKFIHFKRSPIFCKVIGNDIREKKISDVWYEFLKDTELMNNINRFKTNDIIGHPLFYYYEKTGTISPGTLCFMSILHDINTRLTDVKGKKVCEIGSGYGGQAKILIDHGAESLDLIDRKETLGLASKYLNIFKYKNVNFHTTDSIVPQDYDIVISNWALSELDEDGIEFYLDNVISRSQYGYFLVNFREDMLKQKWLVNKLDEIFSTVLIEEENPPTNEITNYVFLCSK